MNKDKNIDMCHIKTNNTILRGEDFISVLFKVAKCVKS